MVGSATVLTYSKKRVGDFDFPFPLNVLFFFVPNLRLGEIAIEYCSPPSPVGAPFESIFLISGRKCSFELPLIRMNDFLNPWDSRLKSRHLIYVFTLRGISTYTRVFSGVPSRNRENRTLSYVEELK